MDPQADVKGKIMCKARAQSEPFLKAIPYWPKQKLKAALGVEPAVR